jgi:hypothetical protein
MEIDAPDGAAALELERRLVALRPTALCSHERWHVDLAGVHSVEDVEAEVRTWLRQIGTAAATVRVDGRPVTLAAEPRRRHRASHADFIG